MTKVFINKEIEFDAGHRVPNHKSKCRNPHGHRYKVDVTCYGDIIEEPGAPDEGMLIDFSELKHFMIKYIHDPLDHGFIVWEKDEDLLQAFMWWDPAHIPNKTIEKSAGMDPAWKIVRFPYIPTAENIARWIWEQLQPVIDSHFRGNLELFDVEVWETPTSRASFGGD